MVLQQVMSQRQLKEMRDSTIVVIRSSNERTSDFCEQICAKQIEKENLITVREVPFERALRKCYEIGIASSRKWMVTVDADVLLVEGAVDILVRNAERMPENFVQLEGRVFDKITGRYRQAGHRIYRTALLPLAMEYIPPDGTEIRPEFSVLQRMSDAGYPSRRIADVVGLHDFEQSYFDLYRKSYVHAIKHSHWIVDIVERCSELLCEDSDYLVIQKGLLDGLISRGGVSIDTRKFERLGKVALESIGVMEKQPLENAELSVRFISEIFNCLAKSNPVPDFVIEDSLIGCHIGKKTWKDEVYRRLSEQGVLRGSISVVGGGLIRIGKILDK